MCTTNTIWFEIAIVSIIFNLGNMLMGHFKERTPKIRRVSEDLLVLLIVCLISVYFCRSAAMIFLSLFVIPLLYVHGYYLLRKKVINGYTEEPKGKYYDFRKWDKNIFLKDEKPGKENI